MGVLWWLLLEEVAGLAKLAESELIFPSLLIQEDGIFSVEQAKEGPEALPVGIWQFGRSHYRFLYVPVDELVLSV